MIRKNHNHKLQTNPWLHEEEPHHYHETPERQTKQSKMIAKLERTQCNEQQNIEKNTESHNGSNN